MFQRGLKQFLREFKEGFKKVCFKDILIFDLLFKKKFQGVMSRFQNCFKEMSKGVQGNFKSKRCFKSVSRAIIVVGKSWTLGLRLLHD